MGLPCFNASTAFLHQSQWNMTMARCLSFNSLNSLLYAITSVLLALSNLACKLVAVVVMSAALGLPGTHQLLLGYLLLML